MSGLIYRIDDGLATITLSNPPENKLTAEMLDALPAALTAIGKSDARALLICAQGSDFSSGVDVDPWQGMTQRELRTSLDGRFGAFNRIERLSIPTIAAVQGMCLGFGFELAMRADVIFAGESASFAHTEQSLGLVTLFGGVYRVAERVGRSKAMLWALTSERVPARVMEHYGVVGRVVPDAKLHEEATSFAKGLARGPTRAHAAYKSLLRVWMTGGLRAADSALFDISMPLFETDDAKMALAAAADASKAGLPMPELPFHGK